MNQKVHEGSSHGLNWHRSTNHISAWKDWGIDKNIISDDRQSSTATFKQDTSQIQATITSAWATLLSKSQCNGQTDGIQQTISAYVYINQRAAQTLVNSLYFFVKWLYMFRTIISSSSGATFNELYSATGTFMPVRLAAVWPYSSQTYWHVPIALYSSLNVAPDDELMIVQNM